MQVLSVCLPFWPTHSLLNCSPVTSHKVWQHSFHEACRYKQTTFAGHNVSHQRDKFLSNVLQIYLHCYCISFYWRQKWSLALMRSESCDTFPKGWKWNIFVTYWYMSIMWSGSRLAWNGWLLHAPTELRMLLDNLVLPSLTSHFWGRRSNTRETYCFTSGWPWKKTFQSQ